jgi:hypothetical protein
VGRAVIEANWLPGSSVMLTAMRRASSRVAGVRLSAARLVLEIDVGERLPVGVTDDEARARRSNRP